METYSESKSNYLAFGFTISIHLLLFFILIFTVFVKPHLPEKTFLNSSSDNARNDGLFSLETMTTSQDNFTASANFSSTFITDPNEASVNLKTCKHSANTKKISDANDADLKKALQKIHNLKNKTGKNKNSERNGTQDPGNTKTNGTPPSMIMNDSYFLMNRMLISKPEVILNSSEEGKVVVEIIVDENGKVIRATPGQRGSTTTSSNLFAKATQAAYQAKFNSSPEGIKEQRGTYTFIFTLE